MAEVALNWSEAIVENGELKLPLDGEVPDGWQQHFERTVKLLGTSEWGEVALEEQGVRVAKVQAGSEDKLRHYLEGVVDQANSAHEAEQETEREDDQREDDGPQGEDAEMTERFRGFGAAESEPKEEDPSASR